VSPEVLAFTEAMEDSLQAPRIQRLATIFGQCQERLYVPLAVTLQNRVLIASRVAEGTPPVVGDTVLDRIRARVAEEGSRWPLDFRPVPHDKH
jgi:hypothetical protein